MAGQDYPIKPRDWNPHESQYVRSLHFKEEDIYSLSQARVYLRDYAVPTLRLDSSAPLVVNGPTEQAGPIQDGVKVTGYFAWSLTDNFEWADGYTKKFGLYSLDFSSPDLPRVAKASSFYYSSIIRDNGFVAENQSCHTHCPNQENDFDNYVITVV